MAKILIVDDDANIRKVVHSLLNAAGHEVVEASDGQTACKVAMAEQPEAIFLDVVMPGTGGMATLDQLKNNAQTARIPVIMLTGHSSDRVQERCMAKGADHFLAKPWKPGELNNVIQRSLGQETMPYQVRDGGAVQRASTEDSRADGQKTGLRISELKAVATEFIGNLVGYTSEAQLQAIDQVSLRIKSTTPEGTQKVYRLEGTGRIYSLDRSKYLPKRFYLTVVADQWGRVVDRYGQVMDEGEVNVR